ncbi:MAG: LPS-assembly protein LptD [Hyphomonadaceae bacterium]|nr:LPS-assembly protein LptD [Hyphomonadaceae bacterium]
MSLPKILKITPLIAACSAAFFWSLSDEAAAQIRATSADRDRKLKLADDSPYRDPDIIYLEADELVSDDAKQLLIASGQVEGRYGDRTLRADRIVYNLETGRIVATGNVALVGATGSAQFADRLELSNELEAGTATDFTSRLSDGSTTGAKLAVRRTDGGIDLYNAYYTACEACEEDGKTKSPTWQIKARRVSQDLKNNTIRYNDAILEFLGVPVMYTPYMAHPDPSVGRTSGVLRPSFGTSNNKGLHVEIPYFIAVDDYTDLVFKPRFFSRVTPIMGIEFRRKFYSGKLDIDGSLTYASAFDSEGNAFTADDVFDPANEAPVGERLRFHFSADGQFRISEDWDWGFSARAVSDDLYPSLYRLSLPKKSGPYKSSRRQAVSEIFALGQDDNFRLFTSAYGFQSLRTSIRENRNKPRNFTILRRDDGILPTVAPKIELNKYYTDPIIRGRLGVFGDLTRITRKVGTDYTRGTIGLDWNRTFVGPLGIEAKPFGLVRYDYFEFEPENADKVDFDRALGQFGADIRWPFIRSGKNVDIILEPRVQVTRNFGQGLNDHFTIRDNNGKAVSLMLDSIGIDLDEALFWSPNKSTGYDFWQEGFRADIGGAATAFWDDSFISLFAGQSYASGFDDDFLTNSGLSGDKSDVVGVLELNLNNKFTLKSRVRYDEDSDIFRRIDTSIGYRHKFIKTTLRHYKIDDSIADLIDESFVPSEEISGQIELKFTDNWSVSYKAERDIDRRVTRGQVGLTYEDECTMVELVYRRRAFDDLLRDSEDLRVRFSLRLSGRFRDT